MPSLVSWTVRVTFGGAGNLSVRVRTLPKTATQATAIAVNQARRVRKFNLGKATDRVELLRCKRCKAVRSSAAL